MRRREQAHLCGSDSVPVGYSIVGVQKAATTTLHALLTSHPNVAPGPRKELHIFDREPYAPRQAEGYCVTRTSPHETIAGDSTPSYLFWPNALHRMAAVRPGIRVIAVFRDPVDRAFSHWMMQASRSSSFPGFDEAVARWGKGSYDDVLAGLWPQKKLRTHSLIPRGFYGAQLRQGYASIPRSQWLHLRFEDVIADQHMVARLAFQHLQLSQFSVDGLTRRHVTPSGLARRPPSPETLASLASTYEHDLQSFTQITQLDTSDWSTARYLRGELSAKEWSVRLAAKLA
jgi:hypothetical protein